MLYRLIYFINMYEEKRIYNANGLWEIREKEYNVYLINIYELDYIIFEKLVLIIIIIIENYCKNINNF